MRRCRINPSHTLSTLLDFSSQPLTNRFAQAAGLPVEKFPLALGISSGGLLQQIDPAPVEAVRPRYSWLTYNETEAHLEDLADRVLALAGVTSESPILGLSHIDGAALKRLCAKGAKATEQLDLKLEFPAAPGLFGLETLQALVNPAWAKDYVQRHGSVSVVLARYIFEHTHKPVEFLSALRTLVGAKGHIVLEVPDASRMLELRDYTMPWEEHLFYFTATTFENSLLANGFTLVDNRVLRYPYAVEDSLVAILSPDDHAPVHEVSIESERARAQAYAKDFESTRSTIQRYLRHYRTHHGKIAVLGAGHMAATYLNLLEIADLVEFIVDDAPHKQGLFMPGCDKPILPSSALLQQEIKLCLLSVNHNTEDRVVQRLSAFVEAGGEFKSIFRNSPRSLPLC